MKSCSKCKRRPRRSSGQRYCQPCATAYNSKWFRDNPGAMSASNRKRKVYLAAWRREKYATDPSFRMRVLLGSRLSEELRRVNTRRRKPVMELVGCSREKLIQHIEDQFKPGMTWVNHGVIWHLDHRLPCASFDLTKPWQQRLCFHWSNLQPLYVGENLRKSSKI